MRRRRDAVGQGGPQLRARAPSLSASCPRHPVCMIKSSGPDASRVACDFPDRLAFVEGHSSLSRLIRLVIVGSGRLNLHSEACVENECQQAALNCLCRKPILTGEWSKFLVIEPLSGGYECRPSLAGNPDVGEFYDD